VTVTAKVYVHAYESAKRSAARSSRLESMYGPPMMAQHGVSTAVPGIEGGEIPRHRAYTEGMSAAIHRIA
jgi:hypothetical protein